MSRLFGDFLEYIEKENMSYKSYKKSYKVYEILWLLASRYFTVGIIDLVHA